MDTEGLYISRKKAESSKLLHEMSTEPETNVS